MTNKTYIKNTILLFTAMAVTKIVGAVFKIPLANILGGTGMGYFSAAYGLYSPIFAVTAAGIPTVLMRLTAQNMASGRYQNAEKTKKTALVLFTAIGAAGMCLIWLLASFFADNIACSPLSKASIVMIAPAVLFCCAASVYRGYYEGRFNVVPTSLANVTEAVSRAIIGLGASYGVLLYSKHCFHSGLAFIGQHYNTYTAAYEAALPIAAAGAILAVTLSELCGLIALLIHDKATSKKSRKTYTDNDCDSTKTITAKLIRSIIPIAAFALVMNCFSFIDLVTVTRTLEAVIAEYPDYCSRAFADIFAAGVTKAEFANFAYGSYTGIAISLFMLIPSFAGMTEKTSIPEISTAWERNDRTMLCEKTSTLFKASSLICFPACFGAAAMAEPILTMLYSNRSAEVSMCLDSFVVLCFGGIFMVYSSALSGFFQAIGRSDIPLWIMLSAVAVKAVANPLIISVPQINIAGAAAATVLSYLTAAVIGFILLRKYISTGRCLIPIIPIFLSGILCAVIARTVYELTSMRLAQPICTVLSVISGGFVYVLLLILTGVFRTSPIIKSEKQKN